LEGSLTVDGNVGIGTMGRRGATDGHAVCSERWFGRGLWAAAPSTSRRCRSPRCGTRAGDVAA